MRRCAALAVLGAGLLGAPEAQAEERNGALAWSIAGLEGGMLAAGALALSLETPGKPSSAGRVILYSLTPLVFAGTGAWLGAQYNLHPAPAHAIHGAIWGGAAGVMASILYQDPTGNDLGITAANTLPLALLGAAAGGTVGALVPSRRASVPWLFSPAIGLLASLPVAGVLVLATPRWSANKTIRWTMSSGILAGLAVGATLAWALPSGQEKSASEVSVSGAW